MSTPDTLEAQAMSLMSEALDIPEAERSEWLRKRCGGDDRLRLRVMALLDADSGHTVLQTGAAGRDSYLDDEAAPERAGAYRIVDLIGRGGMGAVYLGEREAGDFEHQVAIKVIRAGMLRSALVERFNHERQILASLNHPNIARLFDGGYLDDGSPFIVMEYVDGKPVLDWADAHKLGETARLSLFRDACAAVAYAHQNLVIHRDITPSNVLVTADGLVKLIDFGIARPHELSPADEEVDTSESKKGSMSYTPGYAAPERAFGAAANTLSDIYSLGKLLNGLFPAAGRDLSAIIAKAAAANPHDRYQSVDALIDDIRNYQADRPVEARNGGAGYRFGKYLARRRLVVTFGSLAILGLVTAFLVTLIQYNRAETALSDANARFDQARELSRQLIFDVYDSFEEISGTLEPREELAGLVRDYIDGLALDERAPSDVLFEAGTMQLRLSELYGGIGVANFGELEISARLLDEAENSLRLALEKSPENAGALTELIMVKRLKTMQALDHNADMDTALAENDETMALAERGLRMPDTEERPFLRHLWSARTDLLQILLRQERLEEAQARLTAWRPELTPDMYERLGGGEEMGAYLAFQQAETLNALGRHEEALAAAADAIDYRRSQLETSQDNYYQLTQLMVAYSEQSVAHRGMGHGAEALKVADRAVTLARRIRDADPEDAGGPEGLTTMLQTKARAHLALGETEAAIAASREALALARGLVERFPDELFYQQLLFDVLALNAQLLVMQDETDQACTLIAKAETLANEMSGQDNEGLMAVRSLVDCPA